MQRIVYILVAVGALAACGGDSRSNRAPVLQQPSDVSISANVAADAIVLTATDRSETLAFSAASDNQAVVAASGLVLTPGGRSASLVVTPVADALGVAVISVTVSDPSGLTDQATFTVTVEPQTGVSFRNFVGATFADAETAAPRDINSRQFADDAAAGDFDVLLD